jgi:hypothetical protein
VVGRGGGDSLKLEEIRCTRGDWVGIRVLRSGIDRRGVTKVQSCNPDFGFSFAYLSPMIAASEVAEDILEFATAPRSKD